MLNNTTTSDEDPSSVVDRINYGERMKMDGLIVKLFC